MTGYLDSSVALRAILAGERAIEQVWELEGVYSSELLEIECRRAILRERSTGFLDDSGLATAYRRLEEILGGLNVIELDRSIKRRAMEAFPVHVKTLDALHLSTALALAESQLGSPVVVFSHDQGMNRAARVLGLATPWSPL